MVGDELVGAGGTTAANAPPPDDWDELLDVIDPTDVTGTRVIARRDRFRIHREGLLHRSVHVCVLRPPPSWHGDAVSLRDTNYTLLLQQRSNAKAIAPACWDLSCAEHVLTGEDFEEAALRGLREELGLEVSQTAAAALLLPLDDGEPALQLYDYPEVGLTDYEWNRIYALIVSDGDCETCRGLASLQLEKAEVTGVRWITRDALCFELEDDTKHFTPWFRDQARKHLLPERAHDSET